MRSGAEAISKLNLNRQMRRHSASTQRKSLRAGRSVPDLLDHAQGFQGFVHSQEDCCFERAERTAAAKRQRHRRHGYVVRGLPKRVAVVRSEGVPESMELATDRLDIRLGSLSAVF